MSQDTSEWGDALARIQRDARLFRDAYNRHLDPKAAMDAALALMAADGIAKMRADWERTNSRVDAMFRAFGIEPPKRGQVVIHKSRQCGSGSFSRDLADLAREHFRMTEDVAVDPQPRARGAVATWVVGRFAAPLPPPPRRFIVKGRSGPVCVTGKQRAAGVMDLI